MLRKGVGVDSKWWYSRRWCFCASFVLLLPLPLPQHFILLPMPYPDYVPHHFAVFAATHASFGSIIVEGHSLVTTVAVFSIWRWHDYHPCRWLQSRVRQVMDVSLWPEMTGDNRGCERMQRTPFHIRQNMPSTKWIHYSKDGHPQRTRDCNTVIIVIIDVLYLGNWRQHIAILDLFAPEISKLIWNGISSILELRVMLRGFKRNMSVLSLRCAVPPVITWFLSWGYHPIVLQS